MEDKNGTSAWEKYKTTMSASSDRNSFDLARSGNLEDLSRKLDSLKDINLKNEKGHSLLMLAAYYGQEGTVRYLLSQGADPNSTDLSGNSILMGVSFKGYSNILKLLLEAGADPDYQNPKGQTALQFAEMFGRREICRILSQNTSQSSSTISFMRSWIRFFTQNALKGGRR
ncbi:ankyrin repeat domain-containing protein [Leptospira dzoumogneensis]|uniref:Ankyrin repeat domain-containing protein n=1 Tax=Leptospira dzoumogneensis TaxID=2484904 RepID=A0A4Z1AG36_9LEPT|nr:ankyrin repeat domain-containing protein [Leptospira dzoumogneensis]TGM96696.1 ankyrin repeat domain-containing protein [Leptospira dzoumogneensis]